MLPLRGVYGHDPVATVAGGALGKLILIGRAAEYGRARSHLHYLSVGRSELVYRGREIVFYILLLRTEQRPELAALGYPVARDVFEGLLCPYVAYAVGVVVASELLEDGGFAAALRTAQDEQVVEFATGLHRPGHGGHEPFARHGAVEHRVFGPEPVDEKRLHTGHPVPRLGLDSLDDRVEGVAQDLGLETVLYLLLTAQAIFPVEIVSQAGHVGVAQLQIRILRRPWAPTCQHNVEIKLIQLKEIFKFRIIRKHRTDITRIGEHTARAVVAFQIVGPVALRHPSLFFWASALLLRLLRRSGRRVWSGRRVLILGQLYIAEAALSDDRGHGGDGGAIAQRRIHVAIETVDPDEVESIAAGSMRRIGVVARVDEEPVVVDAHAVAALAARPAPPATGALDVISG